MPQEHLLLHKRILDARNQIHAHADINVLEAKFDIYKIEGKQYTNMVQNYIHGLEEFDNILQIIKMIEGILNNLYLKRDMAEQNLQQISL